MHILNSKLWFPPADEANEDGLLAIGGDLSLNRLLLAYKQGIFPWYSGDVPLWWSPNPRFVLQPKQLKISKSMQQVLRKNTFTLTHNQAFDSVINLCAKTPRKHEDDTWISTDIIQAYTLLFTKGHAHSFEAWQNETLVGGLYGIKLGKIFFGESMFSTVSNASKAAFIFATQWLQKQNVQLIDCQVYTEHLESLGAQMVDRNYFLMKLEELI